MNTRTSFLSGFLVCSLIMPAFSQSDHQYYFASLPVGIHTMEEVKTSVPNVYEHLIKIYQYIGTLRPYCGGMSKERGTAIMVRSTSGTVEILSAYHVVKEYLGDPSCYFEFSSNSIEVNLKSTDFIQDQNDLMNDKIRFSLQQYLRGQHVEALEITQEPLALGTPVVAVGIPNTNQKLSACFGHVLNHSDSGEYFTSACAEPSMSGGALFSIARSGKLDLVGHLKHTLQPTNLLQLNYVYDQKHYATILPFNVFNDVMLSGTRASFIKALNAGQTYEASSDDPAGLILSKKFDEIAGQLKIIFLEAKELANKDVVKAMEFLLKKTSETYQQNPILIAHPPLLPLGEIRQDQAVTFTKLIDRSLGQIETYLASLEAKKRIFRKVKITEEFTTELLKTGVYRENYRTYIFPMAVSAHGF